MAEYIEREAVLKFIENGLNNSDKLKAFGHDAVEIMAEIQYMPAADVALVRHGRWKRYGKNLGECSECGEIVSVRNNYCPNCGAIMDGGNDD